MNQEKLTFIRENAPCYLYDKQQIIEWCRFLWRVMPEELFLYSIKANPFRPVVEAIAEEGLGADAVSGYEVLLAAEAGGLHVYFLFRIGKNFGGYREGLEEMHDHCGWFF